MAKNCFILIAIFIVFILSLSILIIFIFSMLRYFGFINLLKKTIIKIIKYLKELLKNGDRHAIVSLDNISDFSTKGSNNNSIHQHKNEYLFQLFSLLKEIVLSSSQVRANIECLELFNDLLLHGSKLNKKEIIKNNISAKKLLYRILYLFSIDIKYQNELNNKIIPEKLINSFENFFYSLSDNVSIQIIKKGYEWYLIDVYKSVKYNIIKEGNKINIYLFSNRDTAINFVLENNIFYKNKSINCMNIFIEEWLVEFWFTIVSKTNDFHFLRTVTYNHKKWTIDMIDKINEYSENNIDFTAKDIFAIISMWFIIIKKLIKIDNFDKKNIIEKCMIIYDNYVTEIFYHTYKVDNLNIFIKENIIGLLKNLIKLNKLYFFNFIIKIMDSHLRKTEISLLDSSENIFTQFLISIHYAILCKSSLLSFLIEELLQKINENNYKIFCYVIECEMEKLSRKKTENMKKINNKQKLKKQIDAKIFFLSLIVFIVRRNILNNDELVKLEEKYSNNLNITNENSIFICNILENLKFMNLFNLEVLARKKIIKKDYKPFPLIQ